MYFYGVVLFIKKGGSAPANSPVGRGPLQRPLPRPDHAPALLHRPVATWRPWAVAALRSRHQGGSERTCHPYSPHSASSLLSHPRSLACSSRSGSHERHRAIADRGDPPPLHCASPARAHARSTSPHHHRHRYRQGEGQFWPRSSLRHGGAHWSSRSALTTLLRSLVLLPFARTGSALAPRSSCATRGTLSWPEAPCSAAAVRARLCPCFLHR
jgi:hypothetical protein